EIEVEVFEDGVVEQLLVQPGTVVPVGTVLATLRTAGPPPAPAAAAPARSPPRACGFASRRWPASWQRSWAWT
ncbi:MAG TPA: 2-oxo acid dehydrogenase subunit E2, partial [Terriglobia bacterium]|nr:2-oxo acid dehydrogenase subunit E2 [Terriglobia bacterium]